MMDGFELSTTGLKLSFSGALEGLEVTVDEPPLGLLMDIMERYEKLAGTDLDVKSAAPVLREMLAAFAGVLEDWNIKRKGVPVPATLEGLRTLGPKLVMEIIGKWLEQATQAPPELGKDSPSGGTSPEELAAMAALSSSLPS